MAALPDTAKSAPGSVVPIPTSPLYLIKPVSSVQILLPPAAVAQLRVPAPSVVRTWSAVPSAAGRVSV